MNKVRPNDPCPCKSGLKFKKCCQSGESGLWPNAFNRPRNYAKPARDIEGMRKACRFNAELMKYIRPFVREGVSTNQINDWVHQYTIEHGHIPAPLNYHGFPKSVCTSINEVVCHGIPCDKDILKPGDIINVDLTTIVDGYFGDQSETFYIGEVSVDARKVTETSRRSLELAIQSVRPGIPLYDVCGVIEDHVASQGCSVVREFTGHGIGRKFHEDPQVPHYRTPETKNIMLVPGMIFTIEPMVNLGHWKTRVLADKWTAVTADGSLSAQFEHTILVTEDGVDVLTQVDD